MKEGFAYDVVIIGGGPAGQTLSKTLSKAGKKIALVEKKYLGGTCLNEGCIPTKTFVSSVKLFDKIKKASRFGIDIKDPMVDWISILKRKNQIVESQRKAVEKELKSLGVDIFTPAVGKILSSHSVEIRNIETNELKVVASQFIVIATGSISKDILGVDHKGILNSSSILDIDKIPSSLAVIGGGVIGIEFSCIFASLGTKVTVLEQMDRILPLEDKEVSGDLARALTRKKIKFELGVRVKGVRYKDENDSSSSLIVEYEDKSIEVDKVLISVGRSSNTEGIWQSENLGIIKDERGFIKVNSMYQTDEPNIYAIGDVIQTVSLAHSASMEARVVADHILGKNPKPIDYLLVPSCVYTQPEVASVGQKEQNLVDKNISYKVVKYMFSNCIKSTIELQRDGYIKVICSKDGSRLFGISILGDCATEMISDASVCMDSGMGIKDLARCIRPHPTVGEALGDAFMEVGFI